MSDNMDGRNNRHPNYAHDAAFFRSSNEQDATQRQAAELTRLTAEVAEMREERDGYRRLVQILSENAESAIRERDAALVEVERLKGALDRVMIGGNHLANILVAEAGGDFSDRCPPDMEPDDALRILCATHEYDVWCCWREIMLARAALTPREPDNG